MTDELHSADEPRPRETHSTEPSPKTDRPGRPPLARVRPKGQCFLRWGSSLQGRERIEVQARRDRALVELAQLDRRLAELTEERVHLLDELEEIREELWPAMEDCRVMRPPAFDEPPIPPAHPRARPVSGKHLRWICLVLLHRHGPQQLRDLHSLVHQYGYRIAHHHPVKALADVMRLEVQKGRACRVRRGVYALSNGFRPRRGRHGHASRLSDDLERGEVPPTPANSPDEAQRALARPDTSQIGWAHVDPDTRLDADQWSEHPGFDPPMTR